VGKEVRQKAGKGKLIMMKYIRMEDGDFYIFSEGLTHSNVARQVQARNAVSAGFVRFSKEGPVCYGESFSLKLYSDPKDTTELRRQWGLI